MGIRHIPPSFDEFEEWNEAYERDYMLPHQDNATVANYTIELLLHKVPSTFGLKSFGRRVVICLLGERLRKAMVLPEQPVFLVKFIEGLLHVHGFFCKNFCLPRRTPLYFVHPRPALPRSKDGRYTRAPRAYPEYYPNDPWYYPESTGIRKLWENVQVRLGVARPEDFAGPHLQSEGYRLEELGPMKFSKLDHAKVMKMAETLQGAAVKGPWSLDYEGR